MTTAIFLILFFGFFIAVLNWLPIADTQSSVFLTAISYFIGIMKGWNWFFPITELFWCLALVIGYEILIWSWFHVLAPVTRIIRGTTH